MRNEILGTKYLTIKVKAGDIIPIKYVSAAALNIINYTDGSIFVNDTANFDFVDDVGDFLTITDGNCYNEYVFYKSGLNTIYVKCDADGYVCIVRKQW